VHGDPITGSKPQARREFFVPGAIIMLAAGWLALLYAASLSSVLATIQVVGLGLGALVTVRIIQSWRPQDRPRRQ
jgi:hypothetical protein